MRAHGTWRGALLLAATLGAACAGDDAADGGHAGAAGSAGTASGGAAGAGGGGGAGAPALVSISGDAIPFTGGPDGRIEGAAISILEMPERSTVTTSDGHFAFADLEPGSEVTLVLEHPDYVPIQTGTITLGPGGAERVTFQAVTPAIYAAFEGVLQLEADPSKCQMVTTVTRVGKSMYDAGAHGEAGATVTLDPPLPDEQGPIYFNASVVPDRSLTETSDDGGVLFVQAPPDRYRWTAVKPGVEFTEVTMKCRAGWLVNASPPWGLQALP